jgi:hypothetical protein
MREEVYAPDTPDAEPEREVWSGPVYPPGDPRNRDPRFGDAPAGWRIDPSVVLPTAVRVVSLFGCLRRLVIIAIVLFVVAMLAFFGLFGVGGVFYGAAPATPARMARGASGPENVAVLLVAAPASAGHVTTSGSTVAPNRAPSALR